MRRTLFAAPLALLVALTGCGGREAMPTQLVQPTDVNATCPMLMAESYGNGNQMNALANETSNTTGSNVALGVVGAVLFWPALFAIDTKNAAGREAYALANRQNYVTSLIAQRHCMG